MKSRSCMGQLSTEMSPRTKFADIHNGPRAEAARAICRGHLMRSTPPVLTSSTKAGYFVAHLGPKLVREVLEVPQ
jgi:hypothetical protein